MARMIPLIHSTQHPQVKYWTKIRQNRRFRSKEELVLVSGNKMVREVSLTHPPHTVILEEGAPLLEIKGVETVRVSSHVLKKITGLESPEPYAALFPIPPEQDLLDADKLLVLDQINDPGNLGTLLRTALSFDWDGALLLGDCCDPFNDKALRASKGAAFRIPRKLLDINEIDSFFTSRPWSLIGADIRGLPPEKLELASKLALAIGNEAQGLSFEVASRSQHIVSLPMSEAMESLNAGVAGGILMYLFR